METSGIVERMIKAARTRGGERLELRGDEVAVLVSGGERLQAGKAAVPTAELKGWLEGLLPRDRWLAFELGEDVAAVVPVGGEFFPLEARQSNGVTQAILELAPVGPPAGSTTSLLGPAPATAASPQEPPPTASAPRSISLERPLDRMLHRLVELGASDLHLTASLPPIMRLHGDTAPLPEFTVPLSSEHILLMCEEVAPAANRGEFRRDNDTDFAYQIPKVARFRVNLFRDRRGVAAVFRQIPERLMSFAELGLPECARALCMLNRGLVLVTGPTGSGKSTTLATMVDYANANRTDHIITIEDPIEFVHENKRCLVHQREVYSHTESFKRALRAALREDPDIVLVGELRDLETMAIAIETAETGHLVFGTLHTISATSTVDRLIDQFPADRQAQIRVMLADSLKGVIAQLLLKRIGGGRVAAYEVLLGVPAVSNLIREGKTHQIGTVMQTSKRLGMQTMNDALADLVRRGLVDAQEALAKAADKDGLRGLLKLADPAASAAPPL